MKKLIIMLIIGSLFAQNNPNTSANEIDNPCEDKIFLELKEKKLDEMTDREYDYFSQKSTKCATLLSFSYSKVKYLNQIRFGQNFTTNNQDLDDRLDELEGLINEKADEYHEHY